MIKTFTKIKRITTLLAGISIASIPAVGQADWSIVALERLEYGDNTGGNIANAINDLGQVVGNSGFFDNGFITGPNGAGLTELGTLGGKTNFASSINDSGQIVGRSSTGNGTHAVITGPNGVGMTDLGTLGGGKSSNATSINDSAEVIGTASAADGSHHAFLYSHGGMTDLSMLDVVVATGWTDIQVTDINNNGQIVGYGTDGFNTQAFLLSYSPDTVFDPQPIFIPSIPEPEIYAMLLGGLGLIGFMARRRKAAVA